MLPEFSGAFPQPTFQPWLMLLVAAILTTGRRTILNLLRTIGILALAIRPPMRHVERFSRAFCPWHCLEVAKGIFLGSSFASVIAQDKRRN
jgi:hypothetical protein